VTTRLDSSVPRPLPAPRPTPVAGPSNGVASANTVQVPAVTPDSFQVAPRATPEAQRGGVPITQRVFTRPMLKFEAGGTVTATANVGADFDLSAGQLDLNLKHPARGDLVVKLTSPAGTTVTLSNKEGGQVPDLRGSYDLTQLFAGEPVKGQWKLTVENAGPHSEGWVDMLALSVSGTTRPPPVPTGEPVPISDLASRYGWKQGEWQTRLLEAADHKSGAADGNVTVAELDAYLADPDDLQFVTSSAMQVERNAVNAAGGVKDVASFEDGWQRDLATRADADGDGRLGNTELDAYLTTVKAGAASAETLWMPDQKAAPFASRISDHTGEGDWLSTGGLPNDSLLLTKDYMRVAANLQHRGPNWVSYELSAADVLERPAGVTRPNNFKSDPELGDHSAKDSDYTGSGLDRGHNKPARDSANQESMDESFLLSNIAPQSPELNQRAWEMLEQATWELTQATGGKSAIFTGGLYLDDQGKPLPDDQKEWIGADGEKRVAVPTHFFKAALVRMPDGTQKPFAYLVPNNSEIPLAGSVEEQAKVINGFRVSIDQLESLLGEDLFAPLEDSAEGKLESEPHPTFEFADRSKFKVASLLWPAA